MASDPAMDERSMLAAELALGVLDGAEREEARRLQRDDPAFAADVDAWATRFDAFYDQWPAVEPPRSLARRVHASVGVGAANDNSSAGWKWATGVASAIAAGLAFLLILPRAPTVTPPPPQQQAPSPTLAVAFSVNGGAQVLPASVDLQRGQVRLPKGLEVPTDRDAQLWLIEGEAAPQPIGLFKPTANGLAATVRVEKAIPAGAILAISIEPTGGSPTGLPTGPVVATGELKPI